MLNITQAKDYKNFISENPVSLVYFSTLECSVCEVLKPKLDAFINNKFSKIKKAFIDTELVPDLAAQTGVFTVPTIILFIEGKEYIRKSRNLNFDEFEKDLSRLYKLFFQS